MLAATSVRYLFIQCLAVAWEGTRGMSLLMMACSLLDVRVFKSSSLCNCFVSCSNILSALKTAGVLFFSAQARAGSKCIFQHRCASQHPSPPMQLGSMKAGVPGTAANTRSSSCSPLRGPSTKDNAAQDVCCNTADNSTPDIDTNRPRRGGLSVNGVEICRVEADDRSFG